MKINMNIFKTRLLVTGFILTIIPVSVSFAQANFNTTRGLGMGGTSTATVTGFNSNFVNPANLAVPQRTKWSIGLIGALNPDLGGGLANISLYNEYYTTGRTITPELNLEIADKWFGNDREGFQKIAFNVDIVPFGISYQRKNIGFSLAIRSRVMGETGLSKGAFLSTTGLNPTIFGDFRDFDIQNRVIGFAELSAGFGMKVWESDKGTDPGTIKAFVGVAPKYMVPLHYHEFNLKSRLRVQESPYLITHEFAYDLNAVGQLGIDLKRFADDRASSGEVPKTDGYFDNSFDDMGTIRGSGIGLDVGATFEYYLPDPISLWIFRGEKHRIRGSVAVTDIGSLKYSDSATRIFNTGIFNWDGLDVNQDRLDEEFDNSFGDYFDSVVSDSVGRDIYLNFKSETPAEHTIRLPGNFNIGFAYDIGKLTLAMDIGKGVNTLANNSTNTNISLGAEFRPIRAFPIRVGMRTGGYASNAYSFGTGLNFKNFELTFAAMTVANSESSGTSLAFAFSGLVFRF